MGLLLFIATSALVSSSTSGAAASHFGCNSNEPQFVGESSLFFFIQGEGAARVISLPIP